MQKKEEGLIYDYARASSWISDVLIRFRKLNKNIKKFESFKSFTSVKKKEIKAI